MGRKSWQEYQRENEELRAENARLRANAGGNGNGIALPPNIPALPEKGHVSRRVDISRLSLNQATGLRRLVMGLAGNGAVLLSGKCVTSSTGAIQWLLEKTMAAITVPAIPETGEKHE